MGNNFPSTDHTGVETLRQGRGCEFEGEQGGPVALGGTEEQTGEEARGAIITGQLDRMGP